jgi:methylaspartate ammonia-lyase
MKINQVLFTKSYTGFYFDDQKAIKNDAIHDGFLYIGEPQTQGFEKVRVPGEAISIQLILDNKDIAVGDCAAVQYSGAGGRDPLFLAKHYIPIMETYIKPLLEGLTLTSFKDTMRLIDDFKIDGKRLHTAIRYGLSQAILSAISLKEKKSMAEVIRDEYNPNLKDLKSIPIFAQTGDDRYTNVDKMILKEVESLPHALINNVKEKLGLQGEKLIAYIEWLKNRILTQRLRDDYNPIIHIDVYGTIGIAFHDDMDKIVLYCRDLEEAAAPFKLRLEGPFDQGNREDTMLVLQKLTALLDRENIGVEIVADEWCNNLDDIKYFADNKAGHVLQIKTPDLGGLHHIAEAILYCKEKGIGAYCGGTCNETNLSAIATTHVAIGAGADLCLAKPGMDVDSGYMIVKNEMERTIELSKMKR